MNDQLDYRDGHEQTDVAPVLVDRLPDGGVRVVVCYPRDVRIHARNRFFIAVSVAIAWGLSAIWMAGGTRFLIVRALIAGSFWPLAPAIVIIMAIVWRQAQRLYVIEADPRGLMLEINGGIFGPRVRRYRREWITEIRLEKNRRGRAVAMTIRANVSKMTYRLFDDLEERHVTIVADALREGLGMPVTTTAEERGSAAPTG
jgi:hypothetical protein